MMRGESCAVWLMCPTQGCVPLVPRCPRAVSKGFERSRLVAVLYEGNGSLFSEQTLQSLRLNPDKASACEAGQVTPSHPCLLQPGRGEFFPTTNRGHLGPCAGCVSSTCMQS